jgi:DNA ligase (NAD+)
MNPEQRIQELNRKLHYYNDRYYQDSVSEISDYEFDQLLKELKVLEDQYPEFRQTIRRHSGWAGRLPNRSMQCITGIRCCRSTILIMNRSCVISMTACAKGLDGEEFEYICELKFDGISLSFTYENGVLVRGVTRGDGTRGDEITNNVKTIRTLPLRVKADNLPPLFEIRGEGFMPLFVSKLNEEMETLGENQYANPRNAASGSFQIAGFCGNGTSRARLLSLLLFLPIRIFSKVMRKVCWA